MDQPPARVERTAFLLGFAGLLPQIALVVAIRAYPGEAYDLPRVAAYGYAALILSFLGGMWWCFAKRRTRRQGHLASMAVIPALVPLGVLPLAIWSWSYPFALLGAAIVLTLVVDRHLSRTGEAPPEWMRLRAPLSIGLGGLTALAGLI